jgi:hypothetical protein
MLLETMVGSDDHRIKGRRGTYTIVQISDTAYEIMLNGSIGVRTLDYARSAREAEQKIREYDSR